MADLSTVWVEINVYQKDLAAVRTGERVQVLAGHGIGDAEGTVSYVSPMLDQATRTAIARVVLPNPSGAWRPDVHPLAHAFAVRAHVPSVRRVQVDEVQRMGGAPVVFVVDGDHVVPRPVHLGRSGARFVEITAGLAAGERYADEGTFLLKAELDAGAGAAGASAAMLNRILNSRSSR